MKFSPRKAVLAGATALALSTTALTAAPAIAQETATKEKGTDATAKNKESNTDGSSTPAGSSAEGEGKGGFDFNKLNQVLKAISGVVGAASTIFAFLKSLKLI